MDIESALRSMGGAGRTSEIEEVVGSREVRRALSSGAVIRTARGQLALRSAPRTVRFASAVGGIVSHRSAAAYWGWAQASRPGRIKVTVPRDRRVAPRLRRWLIPHWSELLPGDVDGRVTSQCRTLVDCMRNLPWDEALAIVDSALRVGDLTKRELTMLAEATRGRGRARIRAVAAAASDRAANPFESVVRAQAMLVVGLNVIAQLRVDGPGGRALHPDLGDADLKILIEAEGHAYHSDRAALTRDAERYNALGLRGWQVVRFTWDHVMRDPAYVQRTLVAAVAKARRPANVADARKVHLSRPARNIRGVKAQAVPAGPTGSRRR